MVNEWAVVARERFRAGATSHPGATETLAGCLVALHGERTTKIAATWRAATSSRRISKVVASVTSVTLGTDHIRFALTHSRLKAISGDTQNGVAGTDYSGIQVQYYYTATDIMYFKYFILHIHCNNLSMANQIHVECNSHS